MREGRCASGAPLDCTRLCAAVAAPHHRTSVHQLRPSHPQTRAALSARHSTGHEQLRVLRGHERVETARLTLLRKAAAIVLCHLCLIAKTRRAGRCSARTNTHVCRHECSTRIHADTHAHTCVRVRSRMHGVHARAREHIRARTRACAPARMYVHACMCACMHACVHRGYTRALHGTYHSQCKPLNKCFDRSYPPPVTARARRAMRPGTPVPTIVVHVAARRTRPGRPSSPSRSSPGAARKARASTIATKSAAFIGIGSRPRRSAHTARTAAIAVWTELLLGVCELRQARRERMSRSKQASSICPASSLNISKTTRRRAWRIAVASAVSVWPSTGKLAKRPAASSVDWSGTGGCKCYVYAEG